MNYSQESRRNIKKYSMTCEFKNYFDNIVIIKLGKYNDNSDNNMRNLIGTF